jgi:sortase (surface protein transpeptidase)
MKKNYVSAEDIQHLFYAPQKKKRQLFSWQVMSAVFMIVAGIFIAINAPAVSQQVGFWWENDIQQAAVVQKPETTLPFVPAATSTPAQTPTATNALPADVATMKDNSIYIPKIKTKAPVIWDVTGGSDVNTDMLRALEQGVARYPQTALPDQVGNVFLTGHSSNYWWEKGNYKTIFALLDRLVVGDVI